MEVINAENPDIIGFQEVTDYMRGVMRENLKGYTVVGCGRNSELKDEAMLIAFKHDDCELVSLDNVWLSATPKIFGSRYGGDQSGCPRMYTIARLKHKNIDTCFNFINTHLDHIGVLARRNGVEIMLDKIKEYNNLPAVFTADMNIEEIGTIVGFANRQSFYASFYRILGETPNNYRKRHNTTK
jgi:endonuclease/exonuclease/phosphatase family metal-dependent hydrolase